MELRKRKYKSILVSKLKCDESYRSYFRFYIRFFKIAMDNNFSAVTRIMLIHIAQILLPFLARIRFSRIRFSQWSIGLCIETTLQKHFIMQPKITNDGVSFHLSDVSSWESKTSFILDGRNCNMIKIGMSHQSPILLVLSHCCVRSSKMSVIICFRNYKV